MDVQLTELHGQPLDRHGVLAHVGQLGQLAGVRLVTLGDGQGRGTRLLEFRSGAGLEFEVVVDRAFDIGRASLDGLPFSWMSPVGIEGPWFRENEHLGPQRGFGGGLLFTGGLDHTLFPDTDDASHLNYPAKPTMEYPLHGRIGGEPATLIGYGERWHDEGCTLWAEGSVRQAAVFGEVLELRRTIECEVGGHEIRIHDRVINHDYRPSPHMLLYHVNFGFPLIHDGARLVLDGHEAEPRGDFSMDGWQRFDGPTEGYTEQVVEIRPEPDDDGWVLASIVNGPEDFVAYEHYRAERLPFLFLWRMFGQGTYVVGLEPSTDRTAGRHEARRRGELDILEPGGQRTYDLVIGAIRGSAATADHLQRHRS